MDNFIVCNKCINTNELMRYVVHGYGAYMYNVHLSLNVYFLLQALFEYDSINHAKCLDNKTKDIIPISAQIFLQSKRNYNGLGFGILHNT